MSTRTVEQVEDWDTVPFAGGYGGLHDLADDEFSGVVTSGPTRLFMLRGTVVGVLDGSIEDFEGADGVARTAPHQALPLLAVMQERSDEVRAKYYTEDTPIEEVDRTLSDGGFTGYVELSENVLSGDYYQVYHQGRSMSVAWVGSAGRLLTDDEAFEQANDEVGIFEVRPVDIDVVEIPEPATDSAAVTDAGDSEEPATSGSPTGPGGASGSTPEEPDQESASGATPEPKPDPQPDPDSTSSGTASGQSPAGAKATGGRRETRAEDTEPTAERAAGRDESRPGPEPTERAGDTPDRTETRPETPAETREEKTAGPDDRGASTERPTDRGASTESAVDRERSAESPAERDRRRTDERADRTEAGPPSRQSEEARSGGRSASGPRASRSPESGAGPTGRSERRDQSGRRSTGTETPSAGPTGNAADLELRSIPSLDPAQTEAASAEAATAADDTRDAGGRSSQHERERQAGARSSQHERERQAGGSSQRGRAESSARAGGQHSEASKRPPSEDPERAGSDEGATAPSRTGSPDPSDEEVREPERAAVPERIEDLESELAEAAERIEDLESELAEAESELDEAESEQDRLREERDALEAERDELQSQLEEAQAEIDRLEEQLEAVAGGGSSDTGRRLTADEAIDGTNLFVRYDSKGEATLETAHEGGADRTTVDANLRLEYHTQFDAASTAVGDRSFEEFLTDSIQYRFVNWLVRDLLYEIRESGHTGGMQALYDALPRIDRAELNGAVSIQFTEDGETHRTQERFDVVVRDRMGNPLVVANINDSRDPASDAMMTDLIRRAKQVGESKGSLAGAFIVTESFFEPESLETAEEATSSGFLSRDKRKSFVNLSRKGGYHLCLVEARNREFHLAVPEL